MQPSTGSSWKNNNQYVQAGLMGALGGLLGFALAEYVLPQDFGRESRSLLIFHTGIWSALIGLGLGVVLLVSDNIQGLRGRWSRDLLNGSMTFAVLGFVSGLAAEAFYQSGTTNSFTRAIGWAVLGMGLGLALGLLRRDIMQGLRGMLGGAMGGCIGGLIFNSVFVIFPSGSGTISRAIGLGLMGIAIAVLIRFVQETFKGAWLMGLTTGPYEGKQFILSKSLVTIGRSDGNDVGLYREESLALKAGAFKYLRGAWHFEGESVLVNGQATSNATLANGSRIKFGNTEFLFQTKEK